MKQCIQCDREYPDSENFCELDGAYLVSPDDFDRPRKRATRSDWVKAAAMTDQELEASIAADPDEAGMVIDWDSATVELPKAPAQQIDAELRTLARHQKVLLELNRVLTRIGTDRGWSRTRIAGALIELEQRINEIERRVQMLLIEAAKDDEL